MAQNIWIHFRCILGIFLGSKWAVNTIRVKLVFIWLILKKNLGISPNEAGFMTSWKFWIRVALYYINLWWRNQTLLLNIWSDFFKIFHSLQYYCSLTVSACLDVLFQIEIIVYSWIYTQKNANWDWVLAIKWRANLQVLYWKTRD